MKQAVIKIQQELGSERQRANEEKFNLSGTISNLRDAIQEKERERKVFAENLMERLTHLEQLVNKIPEQKKKENIFPEKLVQLFKQKPHLSLAPK